MVEETLYSDDSVKEEFGNISDRAEYIQANGLPKTGTYLQPGDIQDYKQSHLSDHIACLLYD